MDEVQVKHPGISDWPHSPAHRLVEAGAYMITSGTYQKEHYFNTPARLDLLRDLLFSACADYGIELQAWAVMSNHYHFIGFAPDPLNLRKVVGRVHTLSAREVNREDGQPGRTVWHSYWDTHLTIETSYFARLKYVHENPVHHKVVLVSDQYPWCSAKWLKTKAETSFVKTVMSFKIDKVKVADDY